MQSRMVWWLPCSPGRWENWLQIQLGRAWLHAAEQSRGWVGSRQGYLDGNPSQTCLSRPEGLGLSLLAALGAWWRLLGFSACFETSAFPNINLAGLQTDRTKSFSETLGSFAELQMKSLMCATKPRSVPWAGLCKAQAEIPLKFPGVCFTDKG